jgi:hypothetical protein
MKPIYLESDEEITSVIDKLSNTPDKQIALVVQKNSSLFQSLVNLKLLAKEARALNKDVAIISGNKTGARLAKQVGITTFASLGAISANVAPAQANSSDQQADQDEVVDGIRVNQYDPNRQFDAVQAPVVEDDGVSEAPPVDAVSEENISTDADENEQQDTPIEHMPEVVTPVVQEPENEVAEDKQSEQVESDSDVKVHTESSLPPIISRGSFKKEKTNFKIPWKAVIISTAIILVVFVVTFLFLPKATVTLTIPAESVSTTLTLSAKTTDDAAETTVPGSLLIAEESGEKQITATGKKDIGTKAKGSITITNQYRDNTGVGKDQVFAAGTKATDSKTGKVFTLDSAITVGKVTYNPNNGQPVYKTETVKVTALDAGDSYNIAASTFNLAGELDDTVVKSAEAFSGGTTKQVTVLSESDVDKALGELKQELTTKASTQLTEKSNGQNLLEGSSWETVKKQEVDRAVGDQADSAKLSMSIELGAIVFDLSVVEEKVEKALSEELAEGQELVIPENEQPKLTYKTVAEDKTSIDFDVAAKGYKASKIDKEALAKSIKNASSENAQKKLMEEYQAESVDIQIRPGWWFSRLPLFYQAITVEYGYIEKMSSEQ